MGQFGKILAEKINTKFGDGSLYNIGTPILANALIGIEITDYILKNTSISATYVGTIPGVPPIPEIGEDSKILVTGVCAPPVGITFDTWITSIELNLKTRFLVSAGPVVKPVTPIQPFNFPIPLNTFVNQELVRNTVGDNPGENTYINVWETICDGIVNWITTQIPVSPTYPASIIGVGVATITEILVKN